MGNASTDQLRRVIESRWRRRQLRAFGARGTGEPAGIEWDGVVHLFDLKDHPRAKRAYAWSSPIRAAPNRVISRCCMWVG